MQNRLSCKFHVVMLLVVLLLGGVLGVLFILEERVTLAAEQDRSIMQIGQYMAEELAESDGMRDARIMNSLLQAAIRSPEISYVLVKSADGDILASQSTAPRPGGVHEYDFPVRLKSLDREQEISGPRSSSVIDPLAGHVSIGVNLEPLEVRVSRLMTQTIIAILLTIAVSLAAGSYLAKRVLFSGLSGRHSLRGNQ